MDRIFKHPLTRESRKRIRADLDKLITFVGSEFDARDRDMASLVSRVSDLESKSTKPIPRPTMRLCGYCREAGHNRVTCQKRWSVLKDAAI